MRRKDSFNAPGKILAEFAPIALAIFVMAGSLKAQRWMQWVPVDLTVLTAAVTLALVVLAFISQAKTIPPSIGWMIGFFLLLVPSFLIADLRGYSLDKHTRLFTLTLLAAIAPAFLLVNRKMVSRFLAALAVIGLLVSIDGLVAFIVEPARFARDGVYDAPVTTIALGADAGLALIYALNLLIAGRIPFLLGVPLVGALGAILLGSGSRGPLLAVLGAIAISTVGFHLRNWKLLLRMAATAAIVVVVVAGSLTILPGSSLSRVESFLSGDLGTSELTRADYYSISLDLIPQKPFGIGLGSFARLVSPEGYVARDYPHNILLETFLEGGWLAGSYIVLLGVVSLVVAYVKAIRAGRSFELAVLFTLLILAWAGAMVSGDLNDNKLLLALIGLSLAFSPEGVRSPDRKSAARLSPQRNKTLQVEVAGNRSAVFAASRSSFVGPSERQHD